MKTIDLKSHPELKRLVQAAFPTYKKHNAFVSAFSEHGVNINSYWGGGSRSTFTIIELATMRRHALPTSSHPYYNIARAGLLNTESAAVSVDHVGNVTLKVLPEGFALIEGGTFCGKTATAHVFLNPANFAKSIEGKGN